MYDSCASPGLYESVILSPAMPRRRTSAPGRAAAILQRLREQAGLTVRDMAKALGYASHTPYQYYETRYKKDHLPPELYSKVRGTLMARGVEEREIRELLDAELRQQLEKIERRLGNIEAFMAGFVTDRLGLPPDPPPNSLPDRKPRKH